MPEDVAKDRVKASYPDAKCWRNPANCEQWKIYDGTPSNIALSASFATQAEAWTDAAELVEKAV